MCNDNRFRLWDLPFPFKAALSICSDVDGTSWDNFLAIHKFLNSDKMTPLGQGVRLPISDSFWFYDNPGYPNAAFSYFKSDKVTPSQIAPQIRLLIRAGILDVMHSYGNFIAENEFSRNLASRALEELEKHSLKVNVWTNHGGEESAQNVGKFSLGKGDMRSKENPFYHSDLLRDFGIKFYWDSERSLTPVVGQGRKAGWSDYFVGNPLYFSGEEKRKAFLKGILSFLPHSTRKNLIKRGIIVPDTNAGNDLIVVDQLRDGGKIYKFRRFGSGRYDWSGDLPNILNDNVLQKLLQSRGTMIVYVHLGDRRERDHGFALSRETCEKFRQISDLFHRKKLWVATTQQLLHFSLVKKHLDWTVMQADNKYLIRISGLKEKIIPFNLEAKHLSGLSFSVPSDKEPLLFFRGRKIPIEIHNNENRNKLVLKIPVETIDWPL